jgi:uncharacterized protein
MPDLMDLEPEVCERLLHAGVVGRVAVCTANGPHIVPLNYSVVDDSVVFRTSPYSVLGTTARNTLLAFEVDHVDPENCHGWSVVVRGRCRSIDEAEAIAHVEATWSPRPWASGSRYLYLRLPLSEISGRRLGPYSDALPELPVRGVVDGEVG